MQLDTLVHVSFGKDFNKYLRCDDTQVANVLNRLIAQGWKRFIVDVPGRGVFHVTASSGRVTSHKRVA